MIALCGQLEINNQEKLDYAYQICDPEKNGNILYQELIEIFAVNIV